MPSTKLTTYIRQQIVHDLMAHRFTTACDKLVKDRAAFASKLYRDLYSRAMIAKIDALPEGWLVSEDQIFCQFAGRADRVRFDGWHYGNVGRFATKADSDAPTAQRRFLASLNALLDLPVAA